MVIDAFWESDPIDSIDTAYKQAQKDVKMDKKKVERASARYKESEQEEKETKMRIKSNSDNIVALKQQIRDLENQIKLDEKALFKLAETKDEREAQLEEAQMDLKKSEEDLPIIWKHQSIVHAVCNEKNLDERPLGAQRGVTRKDLCKAIDVEDVSEVENMPGHTIEAHYRFLKVMGVKNVYALRKEGIDSMRYNLMMMLYPDLLPTDRAESPNTKACKIANRIKARMEQKQLFEKEQEELLKRAAEEQTHAQTMLAQLMACPSMQPTTTPRYKRKHDDVDEDEEEDDEPNCPTTPAQKAVRTIETMDPDAKMALVQAIASPMFGNFLAASLKAAEESPVASATATKKDTANNEDEVETMWLWQFAVHIHDTWYQRWRSEDDTRYYILYDTKNDDTWYRRQK